MSNQIPTNPTPTAVPWTPDMTAPDPAAPAPTQQFASAQPQMQPPMQPGQYQPAPHYHAPQAEFAAPAAPQMAQGYAPQPQSHPAQYAPAAHPQQPQTPEYAPALQPVHRMQQSAPPQMVQAAAPLHQMAGQMAAQPHYAQPGPPPPLPPHMQPAALGQTQQTPEKSKSIIANLLKRSPKPAQVEAGFDPTARSGSLFNKNFILGAVTGLVVGAFVLPMVLNLFGGGAPAVTQAQAQAKPLAEYDAMPAAIDGDTFIDNAIAADAP